MSKLTTIYILPGNDERYNVRRIPPAGVKAGMTVITRMTAPILIQLVHGDTVVRQVEEDGELYDVHLINQLRTLNTSGTTYHLQISGETGMIYQDTIHNGQEKIVDFDEADQFEDWIVNISLTGTPA